MYYVRCTIDVRFSFMYDVRDLSSFYSFVHPSYIVHWSLVHSHLLLVLLEMDETDRQDADEDLKDASPVNLLVFFFVVHSS